MSRSHTVSSVLIEQHSCFIMNHEGNSLGDPSYMRVGGPRLCGSLPLQPKLGRGGKGGISGPRERESIPSGTSQMGSCHRDTNEGVARTRLRWQVVGHMAGQQSKASTVGLE